ncbi:HU family DNA-binding protein [Chromobacterium vaccinii]|uniref:HU family DNA-binding protein n=1 Tax=Chromobacterium vaccinii TaxID=1108595 RepID=UPI003C71E70F
MTKQELMERITETMKIRYERAVSKVDVAAFLESFGDVATTELAAGREALLPGLGKLAVKQTQPRQGRNPKTGETLEIAGRRAPKFAASKLLKDALQ